MQLPASKSISNRALIINALSDGACTIENLSESDDTKEMLTAFSTSGEIIDVGAAGTAMRFLTAYLAQNTGIYTITGSERMKHRPIKILVEALRSIGAEIKCLGEEGFPPLKITGRRLEGGSITLAGNVSSQYISAMMMIAPGMVNGLKINLTGNIISRPYINMTAGLMRLFGVEVRQDCNTLIIPHCKYTPVKFRVENDWSAASYFYEIAALAGKDVKISLGGLTENSLQGDARVAALFYPLGVATRFTDAGVELQAIQMELPESFDCDFTDIPDLAQTFAVTLCLLGIRFSLSGLQSLRIKETDRLAALKAELGKLGYVLEIHRDSTLEWNGERCLPEPEPVIATYEDHRMAMAFAPVCLKTGSIRISDPEVVSKSYPAYWKTLSAAGFTIELS
jgi:3-phosphoshikimate 1-carboxyvinyltransferase